MLIQKVFFKRLIFLFLILGVAVTPLPGFTAEESEPKLAKTKKSVDASSPLPAGVGRFGDSGAVDEKTFKFSDAERFLWFADHLANIKAPVRLYYEFKKTGSYEDNFSDSVYLDVVKLNSDGSKDASLEFFSGARRQPMLSDNLQDVRGNPVFGVYLQGDVIDMERLTEGNWRYFHRKIKLAFSETATIEPVTFEFSGKKVSGKRILITPYKNDPKRRRFEQFADKQYEFILSDDVPGSLYKIHVLVPNKLEGSTTPLIEETLTLVETTKKK